MLEQGLTKFLAKLDFTLESGLDFACKHEELQILMEVSQFERCKRLAKELISQRPNFPPILNNLCQVYWLDGDLPAAIETARKVLEIQPDNIHALANLTRFLYIRGDKAESLAFAAQLKESDADASDGWIKKAEALSFIADDDAVLTLPDQAKRAGETDQLNGHFWHWCAVAEYRKGNQKKARASWQKSLKLAPYLSLPAANLDELKKTEYERTCPQAFTLDEWLPKKIFESLIGILKRGAGKKDDQRFQRDVSAYIDTHPEMLNFVADALLWGDTQSRETALHFVDMSAHSGLLVILKDFALGQAGPDALRLEAFQLLSKYGIFENGQMVELWRKGEQTPIMTLGFEISYESPEKPQLKPAVGQLMEQAVHALRTKDGAEAESHLRRALRIQPEEPSLLNNLAVALQMQDKMTEANALADQIAEKFPHYFFGQVIAARRAIQAGDLEKTKTIIDQMMKKKELHVTEFGALCGCQIDLLIEDDKPDGAVSWFNMWEQGYPEDPALENYRNRITIIERFLKFKNRTRAKKRMK
jgi:Flp pilus assembly protein TadD